MSSPLISLKIDVLHKPVSINLPTEELIQILQTLANQGYFSIKFRYQSELYQTLEIKKERTSEEILKYRIDRVRHPLLRWIQDGLIRFKKISKDKETYLTAFRKRIKTLEEKQIPIPIEMANKFKAKQERQDLYVEKIKTMEHVLENYPEYTYEELNALPDKLFKNAGFL